MGRMNFRNAYEFDPYSPEGAGGLLGMLQAMLRRGELAAGADSAPRIPGNETPTVPPPLDYGEPPRTRITVRPFDAYHPYDPEAEGEGGLLDRLLALQAE